MDFKLISDFQPTGDQPEAIKQLVAGLNKRFLIRPFLVLQDPVKLLQ